MRSTEASLGLAYDVQPMEALGGSCEARPMLDSGLDRVEFEGVHCTLIIQRPARGVVVLTIEGKDAGEHGDAPFRELAKDLARGPFELFVDARSTDTAASLDVSNVWAQWLRVHRDRFHRVNMLTGSRFVRLTADFVRRFAELGDAMHIYTDAAAFDETLAEATGSTRGPDERTPRR